MAFFDELSKTLSDKGKEAAQKARETAEVLQMKAQIASEKSKLNKLYEAVGVLYYKKHRDEEDNEFGDLFREIGNVLANIAVLEEKVQGVDGSRQCPVCKKLMKKGTLFCSQCGAPLEEAETDESCEDTVEETEIPKEATAEENTEDIFVTDDRIEEFE